MNRIADKLGEVGLPEPVAALAERDLDAIVVGGGHNGLSARRCPSRGEVPPPAPGSCEVLDLLVGPLHLDLLGLVVDLYGPSLTEAVRVLVTADPNGGELGRTFCEVAAQP